MGQSRTLERGASEMDVSRSREKRPPGEVISPERKEPTQQSNRSELLNISPEIRWAIEQQSSDIQE